MKKTFHVLSLPHTQLDDSYVSCAYTMKALKLAKMLDSLGHLVYLYGSEDFDIEGTGIEPVTCISKTRQKQIFGENDHRKNFYKIDWEPGSLHWTEFNSNAIDEISKRIKEKDFILTFAGVCQKQVADAFPNHMTVEAGIGYTGTFSPYRVFESYAHMHYVHGDQRDDNVKFYDTVIPNYYDRAEFPFSEDKEDYYLFVGRLIDRKGYRIAQDVCQKLGKRLVLAGQGQFGGYGEYVGTIDAKQRGELMSKALGLFVPTTYLGPFEGVHAEALLCGTPVITTNAGVFTETVTNGVDGYRCDTFGDFVKAAIEVEKWGPTKREAILHRAQGRFSMEVVAPMYDKYFDRLLDLYADGWYTIK